MAAATQTLERLPLSASQRLDSQNGADQDRMQLAATTRATQSNQSLAPRRETGTVESGSATADITKVNLPDQGCSWDDVLSSIEATRDEYERKTGKNRLRAMPRSQVIVTTLHGLTEMIPEQDGLSILRGGLKLIFGLLHKRIENQEQIFRALEDIPLTFSKACEACLSYPRDEALRNAVLDLYRILLEEIPKLADILLRRHKGSLPSRMFKQHPQQEASVIQQSIDSVTRASTRVSDRVEVLLGKTVVATLRQAKSIDANVRQLGVGVKIIHDRQLETVQRTLVQEERYSEHLNALAGAFDAKLESATLRLTAEIRSIQASVLSPPSNPTGYIGYVGGNTFPAFPVLHALPYPSSQSLPAPSSSPVYSYEQLYQIADLPDPTDSEYDLDEIQKLKARLSDEAIGRSTWLMVTDRFKEWLDFSSRRSDLLLVDGNMGTAVEGKLSSLSAFCGSFIEAGKAPHFLVLYHFCGLHAYASDPIGGPHGMVRNLVAQLLRLHRGIGTCLTVTLADPVFGDLGGHHLPSLLALFRELIQQTLPHMTIYCLIDGISEFETSNHDWENELCEAITSLQALVEDFRHAPRIGPVFKVLLTAAHRSITIAQQIDTSDKIALSSANVLPRSIGSSFEEDLHAAMEDPTT